MSASAVNRIAPFPVILFLLTLFFFNSFALRAEIPGVDTFQVLCYHDVRDDVLEDYDPDEMAVSTQRLIAHFAWLKGHGYHPVSIDDILAARDGKKRLPGKAVLITFDDGLKSIYTRVFPVLKLFRYPAVVSLVGAWLEGGKELIVKYGPRDLGYGDFLDSEQLRELDASGLIEFASHSYDIHQGVLANPQGNNLPAPAARIYDPASGAGAYEDDGAYEKRIREDLEKSIAFMKRYLGKAPRVMAWPFGKYNRTTITIARSLGMTINFSLTPQVNWVDDLSLIGRNLIANNPYLDDFAWMMRHPLGDTDPMRVVQVDLDYLYDTDAGQLSRNLDRLLERVKQMKINTVFLQAFADTDGDGTADALYFPNRHMPLKADLFNRVAWQLKSRAQVRVYAWMPVSAFHLPPEKEPVWVVVGTGGTPSPVKRLSLFHQPMRQIILDLYEDLAKQADFDGILFHDDAFLNDFEDAGPAALDFYKKEWGLPSDIEQIRRDKDSFKKWSQAKALCLIQFTRLLKERVEQFRAPVKTARYIYALPVLNPGSSPWYAQSYPLFLENYDFTVVMAMPYMEKAKKPNQWLKQLVAAAKAIEPSLKKTVFELQGKDWHTGENISTQVLLEQMELLQLNGALSFGYYPDDFIKGYPVLKEIRKGISLETYPYEKR